MLDPQSRALHLARARLTVERQKSTTQARASAHPYAPYHRAKLGPTTPTRPPSPSVIPNLLQSDLPLSPATSSGLSSALQHGLSKGTVANYDAAIRSFLQFCDNERIPVDRRFPADEVALCAFVGSMTGKKSGQTIANALSGLKAWHALRNAPWLGGKLLKLVLNGSAVLTPTSSRRDPRPPVTTNMLRLLHDGLDLSSSHDSAVLCAALIGVFGQCRLGELAGSSRRAHNPRAFPSRSDFILPSSPDGSAQLRLPSTKTNRVSGQQIFISTQRPPICPITAMAKHIRLTPGIPSSHHLFSYYNQSGSITCLTTEDLLNRCNTIWSRHNIPRITGHSLRIGGTHAYLSAGVPDDMVKKMGRWSSDAYLRYWRGMDQLVAMHARNI